MVTVAWLHPCLTGYTHTKTEINAAFKNVRNKSLKPLIKFPPNVCKYEKKKKNTFTQHPEPLKHSSSSELTEGVRP